MGRPFVIDYEGQNNGHLEESSLWRIEPNHVVDDASESSSDVLDFMEESFDGRGSLIRREQTECRLPPRHKVEVDAKEIPELIDEDISKERRRSKPRNKDLDGLDKILKNGVQSTTARKNHHRRTRSEPVEMEVLARNALNQRTDCGVSLRRSSLKRVDSFGQVDQEQLSLLDQARRRCASFAMAETTQKQLVKSVRQHSR